MKRAEPISATSFRLFVGLVPTPPLPSISLWAFHRRQLDFIALTDRRQSRENHIEAKQEIKEKARLRRCEDLKSRCSTAAVSFSVKQPTGSCLPVNFTSLLISSLLFLSRSVSRLIASDYCRLRTSHAADHGLSFNLRRSGSVYRRFALGSSQPNPTAAATGGGARSGTRTRTST